MDLVNICKQVRKADEPIMSKRTHDLHDKKFRNGTSNFIVTKNVDDDILVVEEYHDDMDLSDLVWQGYPDSVWKYLDSRGAVMVD